MEIVPVNPAPLLRQATSSTRQRKVQPWEALECVYHWCIWSFLASLVASQFLCIVWNTVKSEQYMIYGRSPLNPTTSIPGQNDEPYSDRNIVCMADGRFYSPRQLSKVLDDPSLAHVVDSSGTMINGYRVCKREEIGLDTDTYAFYAHVCTILASTLDAIQDSCATMGYNVTKDVLRIVEGTDGKTTKEIPRALPILIMPFWDNAVFAHYAIPGWDGVACNMRLVGKYEQASETNAVIRSVSRSVRMAKTAEWLRKPKGQWRNGWYEDDAGQRWYADFQSTKLDNEYGIYARQFDGVTNVEHDCVSAKPPVACAGIPASESWGSKFSMTEQVTWFNQVAISNGTRYGLFMYEAEMTRVIESKYTLETFISNMSLTIMLVRWLVCMVALLNSYRLGVSSWQNAGIGSLSCSRSFNILPIMLLPRLKFTMAAFWTVGCEFEGQQKALSESWFVVYPGIAEFMLLYYSVLNFVAKVTHRRMSDVLFGPTLIIFCLMHRFRLELAQSGWFEFDGRITTVILSSEVDALSALDFFTTNAALRMNGNIQSMFYCKIVVLVINLLPLLLFADNMTPTGKTFRSCTACDIEKSLAVRAANVGGLGRSLVYEFDAGIVNSFTRRLGGSKKVGPQHDVRKPVVVRPAGLVVRPKAPRRVTNASNASNGPDMHGEEKTRHQTSKRGGHADEANGPDRSQSKPAKKKLTRDHVLISYEVNRLGYVVFGGRYLISIEDWYLVTSFAPLRVVEKLWNHRIVVFEVTEHDDGCYVSRTAQLCRLDDERLLSIPWYEITVCPFR